VSFQHEVLRLLEVVALAGAEPMTLLPRLPVSDADRAASTQAVPSGAGPLAVVHPGARDLRRRWPADRFAQVADELAARGARVVVTGTLTERATAEQVVAGMTYDARVVAGDLSLGGLIGLLRRATLLVSNDTGPRHLAEAVGTATVSLFWCGNVASAAPLTRARHRIQGSWRLECPRCGTTKLAEVYADRYGGRCEHREPWLTDVPVREVLPDALDLLEQGTVA
jgi:ADP-heptose:LPS heptosyltransferase